MILNRILFLSFCFLLVFAGSAQANDRYASFVMDADTGLILHERYADKTLHPASLTKMMTMLMAFEAMDARKMNYNTRVSMSRHAASMIPSKLNIPVGDTIRVKDALYALATKSANDVAVALAEHIGGSEANFAKMMTARARSIGMSRTTFRNASGLHDPRQVSTARDMATLARYILLRYPHYYSIFGTKNFTYKGQTYGNHNKLLGNYPGADGFKTGYINASGFNLVASAKRGNSRIIGVVFGGRTGRTRNDHMVTLLDKGFERLGKVRMAAVKNVPVPEHKPKTITLASGESRPSTYTSLSSIGDSNRKAVRVSRADPKTYHNMDIGAFSEVIGQGDYDPAVSKRLETGLLAVAAHTGEYQPQDDRSGLVQTAAYAPDDRWAIQIGAYTSRAHTDYALRKATNTLPSELKGRTPMIVPLRTADGMLYRARFAGYNKNDAAQACKYFKDCISIAP